MVNFKYFLKAKLIVFRTTNVNYLLTHINTC